MNCDRNYVCLYSETICLSLQSSARRKKCILLIVILVIIAIIVIVLAATLAPRGIFVELLCTLQ